MGFETFPTYLVKIWLPNRKHKRDKLGKEGIEFGKNCKTIK